MVNVSFIHQFTAAVISSLISLCVGSAYVWPAPLIIELESTGGEVYLTTDQTALMVSLIEIGNIFTPIPCGYLGDLIGRKTVLLVAGPFYIVAGAITLSTRSAMGLYAMRSLQGLANGAVYTILPLYLGEMAEPKLRGIMSIFFTAFLFLGMLITYSISKIADYQQLTWLITLEPVVFITLFFFMPETPQYLLLKSNYNKAADALKWLRGAKTKEGIEQELNELAEDVSNQKEGATNPWKDLFGKPIGRKSLYLGNLVVACQVLGGYFSVFSYASSTIYVSQPGVMDGVLISIIFTSMVLMTTIVAATFVDLMGRRPMLLISGGITFFSSSLAAVYFFLDEKGNMNMTDYKWIMPISLIGLAVGVDFALANLIPTLQAELFPTVTRSLASSIIATFQASLTSAVLYIYLPLQFSVGIYINYLIYAFSISTGTCLIYLYFPETKGKTFAQIQEMLS